MDAKAGNTRRNSAAESWLLLTGAALVLLFFFFKLYQALSPQLEKAELALKEGRALKLESPLNRDVLRRIIDDGNYYADKRDIELLTDSLTAIVANGGELANLGSLNKSGYSITAPVPWKTQMGGIDFQDRLRASRQRLGFDSVLYVQELNSPASYPSKQQVFTGDAQVRGRVLLQGKPMPGVLVQLRQHVAAEVVEGEDVDSLIDVQAYARTDDNGEFIFSGLYRDSGYSVLPMKPGFEFGSRQGTSRLGKTAFYAFAAKPHKIRLIGSIAYGQLKEDGALMVRTPEEFKTSYQVIVGVLLLAFFIVHGLLSLRKKRPDGFLLPVLLLLCGISILMMFSIQDPLTDTLYAYQAIQGVVAGLVAYVILCSINTGSFYSRWWYDALFNFRQKNIYQLKGWTWLALAIGLAVLTYFIGTGPEGSGVKVNIQFGGLTFQPGEITKYLLLFFLAGFFASNDEHIRNLSDIRWRFYINWGVFMGIGAILALYLLMGDMGPAMVVCFTFLFFYSIARGNLLLTVLSGVTYCLLLWLVPGWMATVITFLLVVVTLLVQGQSKRFTGNWEGKLNVGIELRIVFRISMTGSNQFATLLESPDQSNQSIPCDTTIVNGDSIHIEMKRIKAHFAGRISSDSTLDGIFTQGEALPLLLHKVDRIVQRSRPQTPTPRRPQQQ